MDTIVLEERTSAPVDAVWQALTDVVLMRQWYFPQLTEFEPREGFKTSFTVSHNQTDFLHIWEVTKVVPLQKLSYDWRYGGYPGVAKLTFLLTESGGSTNIRLEFDFLESYEPGKHPELSRENFVEGWQHFMKSLTEYLK